MTKKKSGRFSTPTESSMTTGTKSTRVRDPRASVRFSLDDRVTWDESLRADGTCLVNGVVESILDESTVKIRIESGETMIAPTFSGRLKHAASAFEPSIGDTFIERVPERVPSDSVAERAYEAIEIIVGDEHYSDTIPDGWSPRGRK